MKFILKLLRAEICYTYIYLGFAAIFYQKILFVHKWKDYLPNWKVYYICFIEIWI